MLPAFQVVRERTAIVAVNLFLAHNGSRGLSVSQKFFNPIRGFFHNHFSKDWPPHGGQLTASSFVSRRQPTERKFPNPIAT